MKKTPEAWPRTESASKSSASPAVPGENSTKARNKRRSERRELNAVIRVYGSTDGGRSFYEEARTINVSMHGALMEMNISAYVGQKLMLINEATQRQQICKIVHVRELDTEVRVVAVEFPVPHAEFWNVFSSFRKVPPSKKKEETTVNEADILVCV